MPAVTLQTAAAATTTAPTTVAHGVDITDIAAYNVGSLQVHSTAGSATMTATIRMWGWSPDHLKWLPLGPGAAATKGQINLVSTLDETGTDIIAHEETFQGFKMFTRLEAQVTAIGGTSTAITVKLVV